MKSVYFPFIFVLLLDCTFSSAADNGNNTDSSITNDEANVERAASANESTKEEDGKNVENAKELKNVTADSGDDVSAKLSNTNAEETMPPTLPNKSEMKETSPSAQKESANVEAKTTAAVLVAPVSTSGDDDTPGAQIDNHVVESKNGLSKADSSHNIRIEEEKNFIGKFTDEDFAKVEDSHFIYYIVAFGVLVALLYIGAHNKKKILGLLIEGRRPTGGSRRGSIRYRRLSQREDASESASYRDSESNIIY